MCLEEGVGLSTGRRCSLKRSLSRLFVSAICSSEPTLSLRGIHLMTPVRSSFCSSVPTAPMFLCSVPTVPLLICTYCSYVPLYLFFVCSSEPTVSLRSIGGFPVTQVSLIITQVKNKISYTF